MNEASAEAGDRARVGAVARVVLRDVGRRFGGTLALRSVSATFAAGDLVLVEGHNGSGKSTLLSVVGTMLRPTTGIVAYEPAGLAIEDVRAATGWLSHDALLYPDLTGRANVRLAARLYGVDPAVAWNRAVERLGLGAFAERPVRTYSRGQRQRIALARALVNDPSLLLLDEPTSGLDADGVARLVAVVRQEAARGAVVVVATHDAAAFGDAPTRRLRLDRGRLID